MKTVEERLRSYEPLWENWTYSGEFLGEGAMSSVFEIQSTAMGFKEVAALKIITVKKDFRGEVTIPENALNEIRILRALSGCPNIVHYHDSTQRKIFDGDDKLNEIDILIKMEKLKPLSEGDKMSEEQVIKLARDMCNALIHADEHNIIHRDIKPQNIFVDNEGTYKLGDFGIAKIVSEFSSHYTMNIGTMAYTAPEIQRNPVGVYDIASDIYSMGLVLYVFLNNGCLPFVNSTSSLHAAISKRLAGDPFPSPANGSKNLKAIVMRACNADLAKRYKKPAEMLEDLELLSTGGKKLVVDPFATLDANIDVEDGGYGVAATGAIGLSGGSGALKSSMKPGVKPEVPVISDEPEKTVLKINMGAKASAKEGKKATPSLDAVVAEKSKADVPKPVIDTPKPKTDEAKPATGSGSRLKINMRTASPVAGSAPATEAVSKPAAVAEPASKPEHTPAPEAVFTIVKSDAVTASEEKAEKPEEKKESKFFSKPGAL